MASRMMVGRRRPQERAQEEDKPTIKWWQCFKETFILGTFTILSIAFIIIGIILLVLSNHGDFKFHNGKDSGTALLIVGVIFAVLAVICLILKKKKIFSTPDDNEADPHEQQYQLQQQQCQGHSQGQCDRQGHGGSQEQTENEGHRRPAMPQVGGISYVGYASPMLAVNEGSYMAAAQDVNEDDPDKY